MDELCIQVIAADGEQKAARALKVLSRFIFYPQINIKYQGSFHIYPSYQPCIHHSTIFIPSTTYSSQYIKDWSRNLDSHQTNISNTIDILNIEYY